MRFEHSRRPNVRPHPPALTVAPAPGGGRPWWVIVRRRLAFSVIVDSADGGFARSAPGSCSVLIVAAVPFSFGRASWFATARLTLPAGTTIRSGVRWVVGFVLV